jgi:transposase
MTDHERIVQLEAENAALRQQLAQAAATIARLERRVAEVEGHLAKNSRNSSKPPSSDGFARRSHNRRPPSGNKPGGQAGHTGHTLALVETPDVVQTHRPDVCAHCQQSLDGLSGTVVERRQVHDLPPLRLVVSEHQVEQVRCPACGTLNRGTCPPTVRASVQYGPRVRAIAVYLNQYQLIPEERTAETLGDLFGCPLSEGALVSWVGQAAVTVAPTVAHIADLIAAGPHQHADETGVRIQGKLHWLHVNSTRWLTHLAWHPKRGKEATAAIGIWPRFHGWATHDRWASYDAYPACAHSWCAAHLLRELTFLAEEHAQAWAATLHDLLLAMHTGVEQWRERGVPQVPVAEQAEWVAQYHAVLATGYAAQPPPAAHEPSGRRRRGRPKQSPAKNLLDALLVHAQRVLAFLRDLRVPFTNNQAERDLRMAKVHQKISGTFRSDRGATAFCGLRSYLGTMRKQGHNMLTALTAVFNGCPLPVAWGS